eukprot:CAMPEP_0171100448 /NCGR_PEP_ID=MMETSP0766_2-20121228/52967_1 /TAXON_ID=439317 /ORGANISM="Gambierdiscus australes, Strain CAWD 149" /LENGTH=36 /DNA_ID= /DNA_START= /DNA_END= /DNA_ORIENTATION=
MVFGAPRISISAAHKTACGVPHISTASPMSVFTAAA